MTQVLAGLVLSIRIGPTYYIKRNATESMGVLDRITISRMDRLLLRL